MVQGVIPEDAQTLIDGMYYKIGLHGLVFRWNGKEWIKSTRDKIEVIQSIKDRR